MIAALAASAMLAGCGGSQLPLSVSPQGLALKQAHPDSAYRILHKFGVAPGDGVEPAAQLINVNGTLYGTTERGGAHKEGTVFSITTSSKLTVLYSFGGPNDGWFPVAALLNVKGTLYGTTSGGGALGYGTVFKITPSGTETVLHSFGIDSRYHISNGSVPLAGLINVNGTLYGTTVHGGAHSCDTGYYSCGTVFSITTSGKYRLLHSFGGHGDGTLPEAALLDVNGTLYGTTSRGGERTTGIIFSITPAGQYHVVYNFGGTNASDGQSPQSSLIDVNGTLYGTTSSGGEYGSGTVFGVTMEGAETLWYSFAGSNGSDPLASLIEVKGLLYGTTSMGGIKNVGTVFSITTDGTEKVVHSFSNATGKNPVASLLEVDGTLYGTTYGVVARPHGNVFSLTP
jgi:uncharacterized repeat protein (TIGR03803 family)